jgi:hypothetical protein
VRFMSTDAERRQLQVGLNESSYRRVNEGIVLGDESAELSILCECGRLGCNLLIPIARTEYEQVRANSRQFVIQPGHELLEAERVVAEREAYFVVEKHEAAAAVAERTDPRAPLDSL